MEFTLKELNRMIEILCGEILRIPDYSFPTSVTKSEETIILETIKQKLIQERKEYIELFLKQLKDSETYAMEIRNHEGLYLVLKNNEFSPRILSEPKFYTKDQILELILIFDLNPNEYHFKAEEEE